MRKPSHLYTSPNGGTIHAYPLTGGKTEFNRHLACYGGSCVFFNEYNDAIDYLGQIEPKV